MEDVLSLVEVKGAQVNCTIVCCADTRGLFPSCPSPEGTETVWLLLEQSCVFTSETVAEHSSLAKTVAECLPPHSVHTLFPELLLACFFIEEKAKGSNSSWASWIQCLPADFAGLPGPCSSHVCVCVFVHMRVCVRVRVF